MQQNINNTTDKETRSMHTNTGNETRDHPEPHLSPRNFGV